MLPPSVPATETLPVRPGMSVLAVWSFVLAILGLCSMGIASVPGLVCGIIALVNLGKAKGQWSGQGLAVSGIVISSVGLIVGPVALSVMIPAMAKVKEAKTSIQAMTRARELEMAVQNYQVEYRKWPVAASTGGKDVVLVVDESFLDVLSGKDVTLNPRQIVFVDDAAERMMDPWGQPFRLLLDLDFDSRVVIPGSGPEGHRSVARPVVAWSLGPDGGEEGLTEGSDDVFGSLPAK